ncbi:hypothetical protein [Vibrio cholerae]|uniref:hypothetical protein n=1 Tax=Vibrio cholerae TaxID=666 RepID=UPI0030805156
MEVLIGHPMVMESRGPVKYKQECAPVKFLNGRLLDFALACIHPDIQSVKVDFSLAGTVEKVCILDTDGTYRDWAPSSNLELAIELTKESAGSRDDATLQDLIPYLRELVANKEGDNFYFDKPVNNFAVDS